MSRLANKNQVMGGSLGSLRRLADAWNTDVEWLAYGRGKEPEALPASELGKIRRRVPAIKPRVFVERESRYPNIEVAIAYHHDRWSKATVAAARQMAFHSGEDFTPQQWTEKLDVIEVALRKIAGGTNAEVALGTPITDEEVPPPRRGRR